MAGGERSEWAANWPLLLAAVIGIPVPVAMSGLLGQFMGPLEIEFGWTRAETSIGYSISLLLGFLATPFVGRLVDKTNARLLVLPGIVLTGFAIAAFSLATSSIAVWIALWCAVSLVGSLVGPVVWLAVISGAFEKNRSMAISITICGMAIAQTLGPISGRLLIDAVGWRTAWLFLAMVWTIPALVLTLLFFHDRRPAARPKSQQPTDAAPKQLVRKALQSATFIRFAAAVTVFGLAGASFMIHLFPILTDKGLNATTAASVAGVMGAALIIGKLTLGSIFDRVGQVALTFTLMGMFALAAVILAQPNGSVSLALLGCVILGLAAGAFQVAVACIAARLFDGAIFGVVYGTLTSLQTLAAALGPLMVSKLHDATGNYAPALWAGVAIAAIAALLLTKLVPVNSAALAEA